MEEDLAYLSSSQTLDPPMRGEVFALTRQGALRLAVSALEGESIGEAVAQEPCWVPSGTGPEAGMLPHYLVLIGSGRGRWGLWRSDAHRNRI